MTGALWDGERRFGLSLCMAVLGHAVLAALVSSSDALTHGPALPAPLTLETLVAVDVLETEPEGETRAELASPASAEAAAEPPAAVAPTRIAAPPALSRKLSSSVPAVAVAEAGRHGATELAAADESAEAALTAGRGPSEPGAAAPGAETERAGGGDVVVSATGRSAGASGSDRGRGVAVGRGAGSRARLFASTARCNDLFPFHAEADHGLVTLRVAVSEEGATSQARVVDARPPAQGFDRAATQCARRLRFAPARDVLGQAIASVAVVRLGFRQN